MRRGRNEAEADRKRARGRGLEEMKKDGRGRRTCARFAFSSSLAASSSLSVRTVRNSSQEMDSVLSRSM